MNSVTNALSKSKTQRAAATTAAAEAEIRTAADAADVLTCEAHAATLTKKRAAAVAANRPNSVISIDGELLRARVAVEIAESKATASTAKHASAVAAEIAAKSEVERCARAVIDLEMVDLAHEFTAAFDHALALGSQLKELSNRNFLNTPLSVAVSPVPDEVTEALSKLPPLDPYNTPIDILRNGGTSSSAWARRLADLM
jgi:hypothetical protein